MKYSLHWYMNERRDFTQVKELNGLALCVDHERNYKCVHVATATEMSGLNYLKGKKRALMAFIQYMAPRYNWNEWKVRELAPAWANDAWQDIIDYKHGRA